jgi:hypothetical protein
MKYLVSATGFAAILALSATGASAEIVCNGEGDCWHVKREGTSSGGSPMRASSGAGCGRQPLLY